MDVTNDNFIRTRWAAKKAYYLLKYLFTTAQIKNATQTFMQLDEKAYNKNRPDN